MSGSEDSGGHRPPPSSSGEPAPDTPWVQKTFELDREVDALLTQDARATGRTEGEILRETLRRYVLEHGE